LTNQSWLSTENGTYSSLLGGSLALGANSAFSYSQVQGPTSAVNAPVPTGSPFWVQYDIPVGLAAGTTISVQLLSNNDLSLDGSGNLSGSGSNGFYDDIRIHTATTPPTTSTPGPLPVLGAGAAFGVSRRLRRRIKSST
jgi:hypothetical protein